MKQILLLFITIIASSLNTTMANNHPAKGEIIELTSSNFKKATSKGVVLVDFWAAWCGPCLRIAPELEKLAQDTDLNIKIGKLNVDENKTLATNKGIRSIPTLILYKNGKEIARFLGAQSKGELKEKITNALKK